MNHLIKRFKEDFQLAGYAKRSIQSYSSAVLKLQRFYNKPFYDITGKQLRQCWFCCQNEFGWSAATLRIRDTQVFSIFLPRRCSGPGTFAMTSNGSVNRPYRRF